MSAPLDEPAPDGSSSRSSVADGADGTVMLVCSSGGHLAQLHRLMPWLSSRNRVWVSFDTDDAVALLDGERVHWAYRPTTRSVPNLVRNLALARRLLRRERPSVVISDGAGVAVPFFLIARMRNVRTVYIEVYDRLDTATLTGRLCHPLSDLFLVQWPEQLELYEDAINVGSLL